VTRLRILIVVVAGALLASAGSVLASTIVGTAGDDSLRGTPRADKLYGKAGNDKLYGFRGNDLLVGGAGNDLLVGGAGADRLVCGLGRDTAQADARDKVASDCEIVRGLVPPPQAPPAAPGLYCGPTSQDLLICFEVAGGASAERTIPTMRLTVQMACEPSRQLFYSFEIRSHVTVRSDRTFIAPVSLAGFAAVVQGEFDSVGTSATGSLTVQFAEQQAGVRYECDSGAVSWQAKTPPPDPPAQPGTFCGFTDQGQSLCFDVQGSPKTVSNLEFLVRFECTPPAPFGVISKIPTTYAIREDGTFSFTRSGFETLTGGGSLTVTQTMRGAFDATGTAATGTLLAQLVYDAPDGTHYECDSGTFGWSTRRQ
jgi:RTX calcium-binding nonapeptide repeat (4 copies)